jgi:hypothetical protein
MKRWTISQTQAWVEKQPWFFGANFTPSTAINQLEMWQADTFDPETIERELGYAQGIGMNMMRVYLHDLLWEQDPEGFIERIEQYLAIADTKGIKTMFVFFDDCWHGDLALGKQPEPKPYEHNSGWLQSPGHAIAEDPAQWARLERYVTGILARFKDDPRIAVWDLYNEPSNAEDGDANPATLRKGKSIPLVEAAFRWARTVDGLTQPLTVAYWCGQEDMNACILERCDIVSFHSYDAPEAGLAAMVERAASLGRPIICTEYMARGNGSTFAACTPFLQQHCAGAINWGLVSGKTQTIFPWGWNESKGEPPIYFHDIFNPDGSFLYPAEEETIKQLRLHVQYPARRSAAMQTTSIPRPEHPRPQFMRDSWINLNGTWSYSFDFGESGMDHARKLYQSTGFDKAITVPFCPESLLSGVGHTDFIPAMWYHRRIEIPTDWDGKRVLLHFGGADYECEAFIDGVSVGTHFGGTVSFVFDISKVTASGEGHDLVVRIKDDIRGNHQPQGKQSSSFASHGCSYTRTTGIWQTVWLEAVDPCALKDIHIIPDVDGSTFTVTPRYHAAARGGRLIAEASCEGQVVAQTEVPAGSGVPAVLSIEQAQLWSPETPFLYDIALKVVDRNGTVIDEVRSYAGLRKVHIEGNRVYLNDRPLYQRLVLDQGFYPDGIWTAPSDEALKRDILLSMQAGFNGARLHQKVFEERFHYWADQLGYLTWAESASWGCDCNSELSARNFLSEWKEIVIRDRNHPSIIAWTPLNETYGYTNPAQHTRLHIDCYTLCQDLDPTRPVNDASGYLHHITDLWTVHNYEQNPEKLREQLTPDPQTGVWRNIPKHEADYEGQPYLVDEYGGIKWNPAENREDSDLSWGYGNAPQTLEEFYTRLEGLTDVLLDLAHVSGYCYTQLTDVEQEQNGIYNYDRSVKFDMARISSVFSKSPKGFKEPA